MTVGDQIRFVKSPRNDEWTKGQIGTINKILALRPQATSDIFLISLSGGSIVWATHEDIEKSFGEQLTLC